MMDVQVCWICGAGDFTARLFSPKSGDLIIAADGGLAYLKERTLKPDYIVGDFDSLGYEPEGDCVAAYPPEKDDTDMLLAVKYGLARGYRDFCIYGGLGGRLSHTMANLQVLNFLRNQGCHAILIDGGSIMTMIHNETLHFDADCKGILSVFAQNEDARGVTIENLKYCIENEELSAEYPLGVSNEFIGKAGRITVEDGTLLIIWESKKSDFNKWHFEEEY